MKSFYEFYLQMQREAAVAAAAPAPAAAPAAGAAPAAAGTVPAQAKVPSPAEVKAITDMDTAMQRVNVNAVTNPETRNRINALKQQVKGMATATQQSAQPVPKPGEPVAPAKPGAAPAAPAAPVAPQK